VLAVKQLDQVAGLCRTDQQGALLSDSLHDTSLDVISHWTAYCRICNGFWPRSTLESACSSIPAHQQFIESVDNPLARLSQ